MTDASTGHSPWRLFVDFLSSRLGSAVLSLGTIVVVTRSAPVETAGVYIAATAYAALLFSLLDLGTGPALVRRAASGDVKREITVFVWTRLALTLAVLAIGAVCVPVLFPEGSRTAGVLSLVYVASSMYSVVGPIGQVLGNAKPFRNFTLLQGGVVFGSVSAVVLLVEAPTAAALVGAYSLGAVVATAGALLWVRQHMHQLPMSTIAKEVRSNFRDLALLGAATGAGAIYPRIDQSLVLRILGSSSAAYYGLAVRIMTQARLVPSTLQLTVAPLFASHLQRGEDLPDATSKRLTHLTLAGAVGISAALVALSDAAILILGGHAYLPALVPTLVLSVSMVSTSHNYVVATACIMAGRDRLYFGATAAALVVNVASNIAFLDDWGLTGAAVIASVSELVALLAVGARTPVSRGGLNTGLFMAAVGAMSLTALLKYYAHEAGLVINVVVSIVILVGSAAAMWRASRELRSLKPGT